MKIDEHNRKSGFSLVELMMAMLATAILSLVVGLMLFYGWMAWHQNVASVQMQRDATLAMRTIAKEIRRTPMNGITAGASLICSNAVGRVAISRNGRDLELVENTSAAFPLIRDAVTYFNTSTNANGSVRVALSLDTGNDSSNITTNYIIYSRN